MANTVQKTTNFTKNNEKGEMNMNKVGTIYEQIANTCLTEWYPDMSETDRNTLLERGDFEEIESYIGAKNSIVSAATAISDFLDRLGYQYHALPQIVLYSRNPAESVEKTKGIMQFPLSLEETMKAELALEALESVHNKWIEDNGKKFFDPKRVGKRYMFTSLYLIGWEEAMKDYIFIRPTLQLLGLEPDLDTMKLAYQSAQQETTLVVKDPVAMLDNEYPELMKNLSRDEKIDIVRQITDRSPGIFHWEC